MDTVSPRQPTGPPAPPAELVAQVAELLDVIWERSREVSPVPLSASQLRAVVALERSDGATLTTLVRALASTPPAVSRLCDRLQAVGFVERTPNPDNRREVLLHLTARGREYLRELRAQRQRSLTPVLDALPTEARAALVTGLTAFRDGVLAQRDSHRDPSAG